MAGAPKDLSDATIKIEDGAATANTITVAVDEGNLQYTVQRPDYTILDRGSLSHLRQADEVEVEGSFSVHFTEHINQTSESTPELYEVMTFSGDAASWTSTNDDNGDVKTLTMKFEIVDPDATRENERLTFNKVRFKNIQFQEGRPDSLSCDFAAFVTSPTIAKYS